VEEWNGGFLRSALLTHGVPSHTGDEGEKSL